MSKFIPNSFQVPNAVVDELMSVLSGLNLSVICLLLGKQRAGISKKMPFLFLK